MLLNDELFFQYQRCPRRAYLDVWGDAEKQDPQTDFLRKLQQDTIAHRLSVLSLLSYHQPQYPRHDVAAGAQATLELMQQGVDMIYSGVLLAEHYGDFTLTGTPDLLIKYPGNSVFGDWCYLPAEIKLSKRPKLDYQIAVAFHAYLLSLTQNFLPDVGFLFLRSRRNYPVNLEQRLPQMHERLNECIEMLRRRQEPEVFISRHPCSNCRWYSSCYQVASEGCHLSLIPGITPNRYAKLKVLNITTLEALAKVEPADLAEEPEFPESIPEQLVLQAKAFIENKAFVTPAAFFLSGEDLPTAPVEMYFDIEAEPELNLFFLHGVLVVNRLTDTQQFYPFFAKTPADEGVIWEEFLELVWQYPTAPIYHFCEFEAQTIKQLARRYHTPANRWLPLLSRCVDIHERITRTTILPVESYSLKSLARWMGFQWRNSQGNGAQCVCWYDEWLKTGNRDYLTAIEQYNEDDCRATYLIKDWLVKFLQDSSTENLIRAGL
ncbi:TM0106 family RecB-like putative nuclease [Ancylothrix sp. C2]|uniref:TM0106 family RecB-like putative nuclease n=1 Tax=Ancylothrix sp. D3o TaxID=2953691 RepID=UPI0021BB1EF8|nr:TM0106 family RecB-like putative nuclease [Ancylothrix sp. D3o]MCT7948621.1 TM0106 family RecB-like putative nuclease [Ancylothrix sp. D3o]